MTTNQQHELSQRARTGSQGNLQRPDGAAANGACKALKRSPQIMRLTNQRRREWDRGFRARASRFLSPMDQCPCRKALRLDGRLPPTLSHRRQTSRPRESHGDGPPSDANIRQYSEISRSSEKAAANTSPRITPGGRRAHHRCVSYTGSVCVGPLGKSTTTREMANSFRGMLVVRARWDWCLLSSQSLADCSNIQEHLLRSFRG